MGVVMAPAVLWGMGLGYGAGVVFYALVRLGVMTLDPSYASTLVPLVVIPLLSLASPATIDDATATHFRDALRGHELVESI